MMSAAYFQMVKQEGSMCICGERDGVVMPRLK